MQEQRAARCLVAMPERAHLAQLEPDTRVQGQEQREPQEPKPEPQAVAVAAAARTVAVLAALLAQGEPMRAALHQSQAVRALRAAEHTAVLAERIPAAAVEPAEPEHLDRPCRDRCRSHPCSPSLRCSQRLSACGR
jgi:hypothetical protein